MNTIKVTELKRGDEIRVSNPRLHATGTVKKINRVNLIIQASAFGNPVEYPIRKDELVGGHMANQTGQYEIVAGFLTRQRCRHCTRAVVFDGKAWEHLLLATDDQPGHPAAPKNEMVG